MDRIKAFFAPPKASAEEYEPLADDDSGTLEGSIYEEATPFSWIEYSIFALIGVAMLWAWNMFLAAAPYFQIRFQSDPWIYASSQSAITSTSTVVNLGAMLILTRIQSSANYPPPHQHRPPGLMQNGAFSFVASFGRPEYTQAIMVGQGVAGILPPLAQMFSYLAFTDPSPGINPPDQPSSEASASLQNDEGATAAFVYFLTAVVISALTVLAFIPLVRRHSLLTRCRLAPSPGTDLSQSTTTLNSATEGEETAQLGAQALPTRRHVPLATLFRKLRWLAAAVAMCFVVAMFFPVFTAKILSVHDGDPAGGGLFSPGAFIPLGFFFWNLGDLAGRVSAVLPPFAWLRRHPRVLFAVGLARWVFLPLYLLCNLHGRGAVVGSDLFYLVVVQFPFGLTNGWLGSSAMMAAGEWVDEDEREAAGGFMGMCLVGGLALGSVLSFTAAGV
ncbi:nucleoside transporter-domain-containing protein [Chaetomium fimeti]|uniref:Nucleoside transporter-domain-containing protein n=1 Tax=Chaetomium fimeti TaxID=1854472 RepID=A0AAE0HFZ1_9PEZI|nr:nucleoside transporter-domain-containing protein [Chaetomium fimeti]